MLEQVEQRPILTGVGWKELRYHPEQHRLWNSTARFRTVTAGRRSGKTDIAKRWLVEKSADECRWSNGRYIAGAPTRDHAKDLYWEDLKEMVPQHRVRKISEVDLTITYDTNTKLRVVGFDKPERAEGSPLDGAVLDEIADMKPKVFEMTVLPALLQRGGWCWFVGKPRGRNHYYDLTLRGNNPDYPEWDHFWWTAEDILSPEEIAIAKRDMDPLSYDQEVRASFVNFGGQIYYAFKREIHAIEEVKYDPNLPLIFCFDFNVEPGVAVVCQEQWFRPPAKEGEQRKRTDRPKVQDQITAVIGEVWVQRASRTEIICRRLIQDWGHHKGDVYCYGDPSGGNRDTRNEPGKNDWSIIRDILSSHFRDKTGPKVQLRVERAHPPERQRVNSVNNRLLNTLGEIRCLISPRCVWGIKDLEGVEVLPGSAGEILKIKGGERTHWTDAFGYYIEKRFPFGGSRVEVKPLVI